MQVTVGKKLLGLSLVGAALALAVGIVGAWGVHSLLDATVTMLRGDAKIAELSAAAAVDILQLRRAEKNIFLRIDDPKQVEEFGKKLLQGQARLAERVRVLGQAVRAPEDQDRVKQITVALDAYQNGMAGLVGKIATGQIKTPQAADQAILPFREASRQMDTLAEKFAEDGNTRMAQLEGPLTRRARNTLWMIGAFVFIAVAAGIVLSVRISCAITRPLATAVRVLRDIAEGEGDLTKRLEVTSRDEVGDLARWFNTFMGRYPRAYARGTLG
jgi:methyl-accepting chemotaxis protein